ncbi:MAG: ABC transporter permease, partial [Bacillota bacterium]
GAPFKGGLLFFFVASVIYVACTCSIGFLVSTLVKTQGSALLITVILAIVPAVQFSGMFTPVAFLPDSSRLLAHFFPPMYYNNIVQGAFLKGTGWPVLWIDVLVLAGYTAALLAAAYVLFKKRTRA